MKGRRKRPSVLTAAGLELARREARALARGVEETVGLETARGAAFVCEADGSRKGPYRRQAGLAWLAGRGRLSEAQVRAGAIYGAAWRRACSPQSLPSTLEVRPGGTGADSRMVAAAVARAEASGRAEARLAGLRARLGGQSDLVEACDAVCGRELTPREAAGSDRAAVRLEAVLGVALDLLGR